MENRFGVKDFFLFLLLGGLIVLVILAMFQFDRQWDHVRAISNELAEQKRTLRDIRDLLERGITVSTTQPTEQVAPAFERIAAARRMPDFAMGDRVVDAFGGGVARLTPLLSGDAAASVVQDYVLESLCTRDPDTLEWKGLLATDWTVTDNTQGFDEKYEAFAAAKRAEGLSDEEIAHHPDAPRSIIIDFKLRRDVRFSDGVPMTADDVVFTYNFIMNEQIAAPRHRAYLRRIASVEKTGPYAVRFTFIEPYFEAFELAASFQVMPAHFYGSFTPEEFNQSVGYLLGSGPYRMPNPTSWKPGMLIELRRNEEYWGVAPPFERLVFREITNDTARLTAFRNGDIDIFGASPQQYQEMVKDSVLVARSHHFEYQNPVGGYRYIAWNQHRNGKPTAFADKRVRQALTMLIDRDRLVDEIMLGYAVKATGPFNPAGQQHNPDVQPWPYDIERARALLAEAGFVDRNGDGILEDASGRRFTFSLTYPSGNPNYEAMVLAIKDAYARAGIVVQPDPLEWSIFTTRIENKDFDAITLGWTSGIETDIFQMFHSTQAMAGGDNFVSYRNEELDRLIELARKTIDPAKRLPLWQQCHAILHEDQPYTFLFFPKSLVFIDKRFKNVKVTRLGMNPRAEWYVPAAEQRYTQ